MMAGDIPQDYDVTLRDVGTSIRECNDAALALLTTWDSEDAQWALTRAVSDCWREIASVAPLAMLDDCDDMTALHPYTTAPVDGSLRRLRELIGWEA